MTAIVLATLRLLRLSFFEHEILPISFSEELPGIPGDEQSHGILTLVTSQGMHDRLRTAQCNVNKSEA